MGIDGIDYVQKLFLESLWNFIAILCFLGLGVKTIWIWHAGKSDDTINSSVDYANNYPRDSRSARSVLSWPLSIALTSSRRAEPGSRSAGRTSTLTECLS